MIYALIKDGRVENVIVADAAFIEAHGARLADECVEIAPGQVQPGLGWSYNAGTKKFSRS